MTARISLCVLAVICALSIGYSRLFLGVHSLDQVFWGLQLGAWAALTFEFIVKEPLMSLIQ